MCTNYRPSARDYIHEFFDVTAPDFEYREEGYPGYIAPMIRRGATGNREVLAGRFGLIPPWAKDTKISRNTYNARSETVAAKPSYRNAWRRGQYCLVPMDAFYEPCYESGKAVRWRIERPDRKPFAVAGIWERWLDPAGTGEVVHSFSMLTVNADGHSVMGRMHRPEDEKRSVVIVEPGDYDAWMAAEPVVAPAFLRMPGAEEIVAEAAPR
jgi:putative SOS response-associated peptidase YedK